MEENQVVVYWGTPISSVSESDPIVFQRANVKKAEWFSEEIPIATFLIRIYDWQAGFAEATE